MAAGHGTTTSTTTERLVLGEEARPLITIGRNVAVIGLVGSAVMGATNHFQGFLFAYLAAYVFFLSIALGALFFVLTQHLTAAGWSVGVRRIAEALTRLFPVLFVLAIPIVVPVLFQIDTLYPWAGPITADQKVIDLVTAGKVQEAMEAPSVGDVDAAKDAGVHGNRTMDPLTLQKRITGLHWLNPYFFVLRAISYFVIWIAISRWYYNQSLRQDTTGDVDVTRKLQKWAGLWTVVFGMTLTGAAGDFLMSLDPHWYSTMWAVYYFAGCVLVIFAVLILLVALLQQAGYLRDTINVEHYHDLGKYLFAFTFFWGYIAFGQFMLLWYANIPEEVAWFSRHGATTAPEHVTGWSYVILAILFGQLLIPFGGLMSRHVKRAKGLLVFWALWQLAFHMLDICWIILPEYPGQFGALMIGATLFAYAGIGGLLLAVLVRGSIGQNLRVAADPRLPESLAFHNV